MQQAQCHNAYYHSDHPHHCAAWRSPPDGNHPGSSSRRCSLCRGPATSAATIRCANGQSWSPLDCRAAVSD